MSTTTDPWAVIERMREDGKNRTREIDALKRRVASAERLADRAHDALATAIGALLTKAHEVDDVKMQFAGDEAARQLRALAETLRELCCGEPASAWTSERPTEPGWWWYREREDAAVAVDAVAIMGELCVFFAGNECEVAVSKLDGEWQRAEPRP